MTTQLLPRYTTRTRCFSQKLSIQEYQVAKFVQQTSLRYTLVPATQHTVLVVSSSQQSWKTSHFTLLLQTVQTLLLVQSVPSYSCVHTVHTVRYNPGGTQVPYPLKNNTHASIYLASIPVPLGLDQIQPTQKIKSLGKYLFSRHKTPHAYHWNLLIEIHVHPNPRSTCTHT